MTYTIILKREGKEDLVRRGVDLLNACIIPAELKMEYHDLFKNGTMSVEVIEEGE